MKHLTLPLFIILFLAGNALFAQNLQTSTYIEQTQVGPKIGTSIGYEFSDFIEVGGFFQQATQQQEAEAGRLLRSENHFYGAYFAYPVFVRKIADVKFHVRTGVSNGENFVITPGLMANLRPLKFISIGGGIGTRAFRPTYLASLTIRLYGAH